MADLPTKTVSADVLRDFVTAIFRKAGCDATEAGCIAFHLVRANLTGHDSHGVIRIPRYIEDIETGRTKIGGSVIVVSESATHALLDGNYAFGQSIGTQAVDIGVAKARAAGMATVALRHSAHLGRIGDWGERAAAAGMISIHFVNVDNGPLVAPFGGTGRRLATDPVCIAIPPMAGRPMLLLDMATAIVAEGKVFVASMGGKPVPDDAMIGPDGKRSGDPATLYGPMVPSGPRNPANGEGALRAFGEHKGSGLSFMCEILAGVLSGGGTAGPVGDDGLPFSNGMLSIYLDPGRFGAKNFVSEAMEYADYVKTSPVAAGVEEVLVPGEPEARNLANREANGVPVLLQTWTALCNIANKLGIAHPA